MEAGGDKSKASAADRITARVEATYRNERTRLLRSLTRYMNSSELADNVVNEVFLQLMRRGEAVREPAAWVWRSAFRIADGELAREQRSRSGHASDAPSHSKRDDIGLIEVADLLARLSPMQRRVVLLRTVAGWSGEDAAQHLGTSPAAVRVHLSRARGRLRVWLREANES